MDTGVMVADDNCQASHCSRGSKSAESSIKIDSISIDLIGADKKTSAEKCEHFSIRGFVSEFHKKDWKMCWPFTLDTDSEHLEEQTCLLPPLHVPRFMFWRCENCLQQLEAKCIANNPTPGLKLHSGELKSSKSCTHTSSFNDAIRLLSNCQPGIKPDSVAGKNIDGSAFANWNFKEKSSNGMSSPKGNGVRSKAKRGLEISILEAVAIEALSIPKQKACFTHNKVTEPKQPERDIPCKSRYGASKVDDATSAEKQKGIKSTANTCGTGKEDSAYHHSKEPTAAVASGEAEESEGEPDAMDSSLMGSKSAEAVVRNDVEDFSNDESTGLPLRRKTRKVRLLAELLCGNGDGSIATNSKSRDTDLNEVSDVSADVEKLPLLDGQAANSKRGSGHGKKRKPPRDENGRPTGISTPNKALKNSRLTKKDTEEPDATANTEDIELAFARMKLHSGKKKHLIKKRVDRSPFIGKKKKQKTWSFGAGLPASTSSKDLVPKETRDSSGSPSASNRITDSVSEVYKTREMDLFPLPARTLEPEHRNDKMKSESREGVDPRASQIVWNGSIYREGPMARKDRDVSCAGSASHKIHPTADVSLDKALNLCLNSYTPLQKLDFKCYPQLEDRSNTSVTWQEGPSNNPVVRKASEMKYVEKFGNVPRPTSIGRSDVLSSKKPDAYSIPYLNEKQNYTSPVQIGICAIQHKELGGPSGQEISTGFHDSVTLLKGGNHLAAGNASERGAVDFPMDVVELMAKNQYERCLPDPEYNKRHVESPIYTKNVQMIDFSKVSGHRELTKTARSGANVGSTTNKPVDFFAQADRNKDRMGQQNQALIPVGFRPFLEHQDKLSGGLQHSFSSSSKKNSAHARKWIEDITWKMPACTGYPNARSCNTCQSIPQQSRESKQPWPPLATNQTIFAYNLSQNGASPSTNFLAGCPECPRKTNTNSIWDLKFLSQNTPNPSQNTPNPRKQTRNLVSEISGGSRVDEPFSCQHKGTERNQNHVTSSDLYSNETIPAMHLLSLMDAGRSSSPPMTMDGNRKFLKRPAVAPPKKASGAFRTSNATKIPPYGKRQVAGSREPIPGVPNTFGVSASSFQNDRSFKRINNFTSQASQVNEKGKGPDLCLSNNIHKLPTSASASVPFGANCGSIPVHSMQAVFSALPHPKAIPSQLPPPRNLKQKLDIPSAVVAVNYHKSSMKTEICTINRNPAEFTIPEAGNVYMIAGEDLKFAMPVPPAKGSGVAKPGRKRRPKMLATGKEKAQPSAS